jgi:hypothetical protein
VSATIIALIFVAVPSAVVVFALLRKDNVRAALSLHRFSFELEATKASSARRKR